MIDLKVLNTEQAAEKLVGMLNNLREFPRYEMKETSVDWQIQDLHRGGADRVQPIVEEETSVSVGTTKRRRRRRPRGVLATAKSRFWRGIRARVRRKVAPKRLRRLKRMVLPRQAAVVRRARKLVGVPTARMVKRRLGIRPAYLSPAVAESLVGRMTRAMSGKLSWR